jgi:hypothetical protein
LINSFLVAGTFEISNQHILDLFKFVEELINANVIKKQELEAY